MGIKHRVLRVSPNFSLRLQKIYPPKTEKAFLSISDWRKNLAFCKQKSTQMYAYFAHVQTFFTFLLLFYDIFYKNIVKSLIISALKNSLLIIFCDFLIWKIVMRSFWGVYRFFLFLSLALFLSSNVLLIVAFVEHILSIFVVYFF